ncbi:MAG: hypothetical protein M1337_04265 [Actinobacteria bacterium]|nr:hypothetical protein [Actinomycetota bacterium]
MRRLIPCALATVLLVVAFVGVAQAASPQNIYDDYAADGKLTGPYTATELTAVAGDATLHQYGNPTVLAGLESLATAVAGAMRAEGLTFEQALAKVLGASTGGGGGGRSTFPFTGFELFVAIAGSVLLLGGGVVIRKVAR